MPVAELSPHAATAEDDAFWQAWDTFFAALRRARGRAANELDSGLTLSQYRLLCAVDRSPNAGLRELAELVGAAAPTVTRMLTTLERSGVLIRLPHPEGNRRLQVRLTPYGVDLLEQKRTVIDSKRAAVFALLTPDERAQAQALMPRLAQAMDAL